MNKPLLATLVILTTAIPGPAALAQDVFDLEVGDAMRRQTTLAPTVDVIVATADGTEVTPDDLAARLAGVRLLLIGESHTSIEFHRVQERVLRALQDSGRKVLVGLEMYPVTEQGSLDRWNSGEWTASEFVANSEWYRHWGYNWLYYRDIFAAARAGGSPMFAINAPRTSVSAVRREGYANLSDEARFGLAPEIDTDDDDHLKLFKAYFGDDDGGGTHGGMTDEQWQAMFAAQCTWDGAMAWNAVQQLQADADPDSIMVVMVGSGHVAYGLGIARQAAAYFDGGIATLIPVPTTDDDGAPVTAVRASYADFVWGIQGETQPQYPSLGLSVSETDDGLSVLFADPSQLGGAAGIAAGDRIIAFDGWEVSDKLTYNRLVGDRRWGDTVRLTVQRGEDRLEVEIPLRRTGTGH